MRYSIVLFLFVLGFPVLNGCLNGQNAGKVSVSEKITDQKVGDQNVAVYYFHYTRRCATCNAVESVAKDAVLKYNGAVHFAEYNLDNEDGEAFGNSLDVFGQTLVVVAGDNHINLTNEGFLHALSDPEKLKALIHEKIDPLL